MPLYAMSILFSLDSYLSFSIPGQVKGFIFATVLITTFALPALFVLLLYQRGKIKTLEMETVDERRLSFLTTAVFYMIAYWMMRLLPLPQLFPAVFAGASVMIVLAFFVSFQWKISVHMMGVGALLGLLWCLPEILYVNILPWFIFLLIAAGLIGTTRLLRDAHTPAQVYSGFFLGFIVQMGFIRYLT